MRHFPPPLTRAAGWALLGAVLALAPAHAATENDGSTALARYRSDIAACAGKESSEAKATCLKEARAALAYKRSGQAKQEDPQYEANALKRCEALPEQDREDCVLRMKGYGTASGSVEGGGIYRELVTRQAGTPPPPAAAVPVLPLK